MILFSFLFYFYKADKFPKNKIVLFPECPHGTYRYINDMNYGHALVQLFHTCFTATPFDFKYIIVTDFNTT